MKKFVSAILTVVMIFGLMSTPLCVAATEITEDDWSFGEEWREGYIEGVSDNILQAENIEIPSSIYDEPVVGIWHNAFEGCENLKSIKIPETIIDIQYSAFFGCPALEEIIVDENNPAYSSENGVLFNKDKTKLLMYPEGKTDAEYTIPQSVTHLEIGAFQNCSNLVRVNIHSGVEVIELGNQGMHSYDYCLFNNCPVLEEINVAEENPAYTSISGVLYTKDKSELIRYPYSNKNEEYTIPDEVRLVHRLGNFRKADNLYLKRLIISSGALAGLITSDMLESINVEQGNDIYASRDGVLFSKDMTDLIQYPIAKKETKYTIPDSVEYIAPAAFAHNTYLENVWVYGNKLTEINDYSFCGCSSLKSIVIPKSVGYIDYDAFDSSNFTVYYTGTQDEWNAFKEDSFGDRTPNYYLEKVTPVCEWNNTNPDIIYDNNLKISFDKATGTIVKVDSNATSLNIPEKIDEISVTGISCNAFDLCESLESITVDANNSAYTAIDGVLFTKDITTLVKYPVRKAGESYTIPDGVKYIEVAAFLGSSALTTVTLPNTVTSIRDNAFGYCQKLSDINIPRGVVYIGRDAFSDGIKITEIEIPNSVKYIGQGAFSASGIESITIPGNVWFLRGVTFECCEALKSVVIEEGIRELGRREFINCTSLESVTIPESIIELDAEDTFYSCESITDIYYNGSENEWFELNGGSWDNNFENLVAIHYYADKYYKDLKICFDKTTGTIISADKDIVSLTVPKQIDEVDVVAIGENAFFECEALESVTINADLTSIGNSAFFACPSLTEIILPNTLKVIGDEAFACCELTQISIPDGVEAIGDRAFGYSELTSITIPGSVKSVGAGIFEDCQDLEDVMLSDGVPVITNQMFWACYALEKITIPGSVKSIGIQAFEGCSLTEIELPEGLEKIDENAFYCCEELTNIHIPSTVNHIEENAFNDCDKLTGFSVSEESVYYTDLDSVLMNKAEDTIIRYPNAKGSTYTIPDGIKTIGDSAFAGCEITKIIIPDGVEIIGDYAFSKCSWLNDVNIPGSIDEIGFKAFDRCYSLTNISIPNGVTKISRWAFRECTNVEYIVLPTSIEDINSRSFDGCSSIKEIYFTGSVEQWNTNEAFWDFGIYDEDTGLNVPIYYNFNANSPVVLDRENKKIEISSTEAAKNACLVMALYKNKRLVKIELAPIENLIKGGGNVFDSPITDYTGADEIKITIWNNKTDLIPLIKSHTEEV